MRLPISLFWGILGFIRLLGMVSFFFLIGFAKSVSANDGCYKGTFYKQRQYTVSGQYGNMSVYGPISFDKNTGVQDIGTYRSVWSTASTSFIVFSGWFKVYRYYGTSWYETASWGGFSLESEFSTEYEIVATYGQPPSGTCDVCVAEKTEKRIECGGDENVNWSTWNGQTCAGGQCKTDPKTNLGPTCPAT